MPIQYNFLKIFLNHSAKFQAFGIILSPNKETRVEGASFNTPLPINHIILLLFLYLTLTKKSKNTVKIIKFTIYKTT